MNKYVLKLEVCQVSEEAKEIFANQIVTPEEVAKLAIKMGMADYPIEHVNVFFTDRQLRVIGYENLSIGTESMSPIDMRALCVSALKANASGAILVHNHPSGSLDFSREDISVANRIAQAFKLFEMQFTDSIIITIDGNYMSMKEKGLLRED